MIVSGICATPHADLQGHVLLANSVDVAQRPPLYLEHTREIGEITHLQYIGNDLYIVAETDDAEALKLNFFSVAGRPVIKEQRGSVWRVTKFRLVEVSLVRVPQNEKCVVTERKASDPFRALHRARMREIDLFKQAFGTIAKSLQAVATVYGEAR